MSPPAAVDMTTVNRDFYDALWRDAVLQSPERFNTWQTLSALADGARDRLEVGPGLRPRLPIAGTTFIDLSPPAVARLAESGGLAQSGDATALPFADASFDLVCAFDIVEHVADDEAVFRELSRVTRPGGTLVLSVPLHPSGWTEFDAMVGHFRRYEPELLRQRIADHGFAIERSAIFGMQPNNTWLLRFGMWWLKNCRRRAMFFYNRLFLPISLRFQKPLQFSDGMVDGAGVDEVMLICRRKAAAAAA
ncbi:MAG: class I SAM-dependent methyltransferase [Planctomycetes bacterium]|nr:class I SAM-dependent methyltransferase [Planctomycetota bacterium]